MVNCSFRAANVTASLVVILLCAGTVLASAQEAVVGTPGEFPVSEGVPSAQAPAPKTPSAIVVEPEAEVDLVQQTLALDIAGSDYYALLAWARTLGLPETGSASELRSRLYAHYGVSAAPPLASSSKTITIVSADKTEYVSAKEEGESSVRFTGRVSISVKDDDSGETLSITADQVVVNRDAGILSARGDIIFERRKANSSDFFLGEILELDMDDWSGVFLDGESKRGSAGEDDALFFRADDIIKRGSDVLVFKDGVVSSCDDEHPHYSIRASRIWILGGNEWAMLNATLSVGEVPLLYLPFFYYPGEEIVFNPVFGYDERFGRYVQTTTYLLGEKEPKKQDISLLNIAKGESGYERKVEGVFLRTTREPKKGTTSDFFKVMVDLYSSLGGFAGAQAQLATLGPFSSTTGFVGIGLSRSLFSGTNDVFTPFSATSAYRSVWNTVDFFGKDVPFRFGFELASSVGLGPVKMSFSIPFYSDAYYNIDFKDRSENMNWLQFLDQETDDTAISKITAFTETISLSASLPAAMMPGFLTSVSISKLASSLSWSSILKASPGDIVEKTLFNVDPTREFFVPYEWTMLDAAGSMAGTLFRFPATVSTRRQVSTARIAPDVSDGDAARIAGQKRDDTLSLALEAIPALEAPWIKAEKASSEQHLASSEKNFLPPPLASPELTKDRSTLSASMDWSWTPTFSWKRRFLSSSWREPSTIDWSALYETRSIRNAGALNLNGALYEGLLAVSAGLTASTQFQDRPQVSDDPGYVSESLLATWARQDAQYRNDKLSGTFKVTSSPFQDVWLWSPTNLGYSLSSSLYERAFKSMDASNLTDASRAIYEENLADWTKDTVSSHALSFNVGAKPWGYVQNLTLSANLPPLLDTYTGKLSLSSPWAKFGLSSTYSQALEDAPFEWKPLNASLSLGSSPWPVLSASLIWSLQADKLISMNAGINWNGLSATMNASETVTYTLVYGSGWVSSGDATFRLSSLALSYQNSWKPPAAWQRRIAWTLDINPNAQQSFIRFTDSYLSFILGLSFKVHSFLDITLATTSRNSSLWRYYANAFDFPTELGIQPINPVEDLMKSFNFFDPEAKHRRESLFKLKSMSLTATHHLHDWDLAGTFSASPVLDTDGLGYVFKSSYSIMLSWRSVSQIKSTYKKEGDVISWD